MANWFLQSTPLTRTVFRFPSEFELSGFCFIPKSRKSRIRFAVSYCSNQVTLQISKQINNHCDLDDNTGMLNLNEHCKIPSGFFHLFLFPLLFFDISFIVVKGIFDNKTNKFIRYVQKAKPWAQIIGWIYAPHKTTALLNIWTEGIDASLKPNWSSAVMLKILIV